MPGTASLSLAPLLTTQVSGQHLDDGLPDLLGGAWGTWRDDSCVDQRFHGLQHHPCGQLPIPRHDFVSVVFQQLPYAAPDALVGRTLIRRRIEEGKLLLQYPM